MGGCEIAISDVSLEDFHIIIRRIIMNQKTLLALLDMIRQEALVRNYTFADIYWRLFQLAPSDCLSEMNVSMNIFSRLLGKYEQAGFETQSLLLEMMNGRYLPYFRAIDPETHN